MKQVNIKIFSLCEDFSQETHEDMYDELSAYTSTDSYIEYTANTRETLESEGCDNDPIANRLNELGADDGEKVLIHIDY